MRNAHEMCGVLKQKQNTLSLLLLLSHTFRAQRLPPVKRGARSLISNIYNKENKLNGHEPYFAAFFLVVK